MATAIETAAMRWHKAKVGLATARANIRNYEKQREACLLEGTPRPGLRNPPEFWKNCSKHFGESRFCRVCTHEKQLETMVVEAHTELASALRNLRKLCAKYIQEQTA